VTVRRLVIGEPTGALRGEVTPDHHPEQVRPATLKDKLHAYFALTKPRIIELLLITTVPAMIVAERGLPSLLLIAATLVGGSLAAGGANAINCYVDRDIDEIMPRTRRRPLPQHKISPRGALRFGAALGLISFGFLWATVNLVAAALAVGALLFYVFVYTVALKRTTPQNIVIGGAAGAVPVLVGWAAVKGTIDLPALAMFGIIFYWTPPHFWALAMRYQKEYAAAGVPMMPVVYGREETAKHILLYSVLLFALCFVLFSVARMGAIYLVATLALNALFIGWAVRLWRRPSPRVAWGLFRYSIYYLGLLFAAIAVDVLIAL
jgi:protoheme IX farnesyltransferase